MANSAYNDKYVNTYLYYRLYVEETATSIDGNTSTVNWYVQVGRSNTGYTTTRTFSFTVNIGGNTASGSQKVTVTHDPVTIGSGSFSVSHASDGTGSCACLATVSSDNGTGYPNLTLSLTTIPRASTATVPTFTLGQAGTITIDRKSSSFTHTVQWWYGNQSGTVGTGIATSVSWTPSKDLISETPKAARGVGLIRVLTYSGSTQIGFKDYSLYCNVPSDVVPTIDLVTITDTNTAVPAVVGDGVFVEGKSTLKVAVTANGVYSSTINSGTVNAGGVSYSVGSDGTVTLPALSGTSVPVTITVVDSRGRSASVVQTVTQLAYQTPQLLSFNADRCEKDGTAKNDGNYVIAKFSYSISELNSKNAKSAIVQYKRRSADSWTDLMDVTNGYAVTDGSAVSTIQVSADYQWDIRFCLKDSFADVDVDNLLPSAEVILDFKADGKGMGIGKTAEESDLVDCKWTFRGRAFQWTDGDTVYNIDPVIASGTQNSWQYIRHQSGLTVCSIRHLVKGIACTSAWGSLYDGVIPAFEYPFTFTEPPTETASIMASNNRCWIADYDVNTVSKSAQYHIIRPTSADSVDLYINYVVIGYIAETATASEEGSDG